MGLLGLLFALFLGQTRGLDPLACGLWPWALRAALGPWAFGLWGFGLWALRAALQVLGFGVLRAAFGGGVAYP